jgi:hypothetical protein
VQLGKIKCAAKALACVLACSSFNFAKGRPFFFHFSVRLLSVVSSFRVSANGLGLGEVGDFKAQMFKSAQMLIEVQMLNLALLPPFCQTPVEPNPLVPRG